LVGSLKLYVSFAKEPYKREDILQKKNTILRSLLIVATPYQDRSSMCRRQMRQATGDVDMIHYGVATISRLLKIIGLFCKRALYKRDTPYQDRTSMCRGLMRQATGDVDTIHDITK